MLCEHNADQAGLGQGGSVQQPCSARSASSPAGLVRLRAGQALATHRACAHAQWLPHALCCSCDLAEPQATNSPHDRQSLNHDRQSLNHDRV